MGKEEAWQFFDDAMRGEDIPAWSRSAYNPDTVVKPGGGRSQNIGCLHATNAAFWGYHHDQQEMRRALRAWLGYAELELFMTTESFSSHVYQRWIMASIERVSGLAMKIGRDDVRMALLPHLRTYRALCALSAGWQRVRYGPDWMRGYPVTMTGSRSFASRRGADGHKRDAQGRPNPPWLWMMSDQALANYGFSLHMAWDDERDLNAFCGGRPYGTTERQRKDLRRICRNRAREHHFMRALDMLLTGPAFAIPAEIIRTDQAVAWVSLKSIAPGSTSFCYSKVWHDGTSPNPYWRSHYWGMPQNVDLVAADPSMRTQGKSGRAHISEDDEGLVVHAQRKTGKDWFDTKTEQYRPGWMYQTIPGRVTARIKLNARRHPRAELLELNL